MNDALYEQLRQHFNTGAIPMLRKTKELNEILKLAFTPEQAEVALHLPIMGTGRINAEELAMKTGRGIAEAEAMVEQMARESTVLANTDPKDGKTYYSLLSLLQGTLEWTIADGQDSDKRRNLIRAAARYYENGLWDEMASSNYPAFRVIPIDTKVDTASEVLPFEEIRGVVDCGRTIAVIPCYCRTVSRKCDHLLEVDFVIGDWGEYLINYRGARQVSVEETMQILRQCAEDGLIHLVGNAREGNSVICNCCVCCCWALRGLTELNNPRSFVKSNFIPAIDQKECTLCNKCQKVCQFKAVKRLPGLAADGSDTRMLIEEYRCVGCGVCAFQCPKQAMSMKKVRDDVPEKTPGEMIQRWMQEKIY